MTSDQDERIRALCAALRAGQQLHVSVDDGHDMLVMLTNETGLHTGRPRYMVACCTCHELLHEATTGPTEHMQRHVVEATGGGS